jgi:hypothetical protein
MWEYRIILYIVSTFALFEMVAKLALSLENLI